jgi:hypothetical protein
LKPCAPILALCGNIGVANCPSTRNFLQEADETYEKVLWIPGALEYATSDAVKPTTWREQSDKCYKSIENWNLKNTTFCQKYELSLTNSLSILATPGWHAEFDISPEYKIYDFKKVSKTKMNIYDFFDKVEDEKLWINKYIINKPNIKKILLTYSPTELKYMNSNMYVHLLGNNILNIPHSFCGGVNPWIGINMYGSTAFRKDAFIEICTDKLK